MEKNKSKIGKEFNILVDHLFDGKYIGRTEFDAPEVDNAVIIDSKNDIDIGSFKKVKINDADAYDLFAKI